MARHAYWDSCVFLGLINSEAGKHADCLAVWHEAQAQRTTIFTSFFTFAEVFKAKCEGKEKPLAEEQDKNVEAILQAPFIEPVIVDEQIGVAARRLMRAHPQCKKPSDAIHLATALRLSVDEMHTYDGSDLLLLSGRLLKADGTPLIICTPYALPVLKKGKPQLPAPLLDWPEEKALGTEDSGR